MTKILAAIAPALLLAGCLSFGADPPASLLTLNAESAAAVGTSRSAGAGDAITVLQPRVPNALATNRVPVSSGDIAIAYVKGAQWVDTPDKLFRDLLSETITARTGRLVLDERQFNFDPGTTISGELRNFGVDADSGEAVVTYDAARQIGERVEERRFEARVPVAPVSGATVGPALNSAANRVAADVAAWIGG